MEIGLELKNVEIEHFQFITFHTILLLNQHIDSQPITWITINQVPMPMLLYLGKPLKDLGIICISLIHILPIVLWDSLNKMEVKLYN